MSIMNTVGLAKLTDMFLPQKHTLITGEPGSGKTSLMLDLTTKYKDLDEMVVVRDIGEALEWFSMLDHGYKILAHVPNECKIEFNHHNFDQTSYDIQNITTLFDNWEKDKINLIFFEAFSNSLQNYVYFWKEFFSNIVPWKYSSSQTRKEKIALLIDEFGDLAPGIGRTFIPDQNRISQLVYVNFRKYRRANIRLIGAIHYFRDITPPVREHFNCYLIKSNYANSREVPCVLEKYTHKMRDLNVNEAVFIDTKSKFNTIKITETIKPRQFDAVFKGNIDKLMKKNNKKLLAEKRAKEYKTRWTKAMKTIHENKWMTTKELADLYEMSQRSIQMFLSGDR